MRSTTAAGTALATSDDAPATQDAAGFNALDFTEIAGVENLGPIGGSFAKVEFKPLKGGTQKHKGSVDYGSLNPSIAYDSTDAGQILLRTAGDDATSKLYSFLVTYPTGEKRAFQGRVFGCPEETGNVDSIIMMKPTIEIDTKPIRIPAA